MSSDRENPLPSSTWTHTIGSTLLTVLVFCFVLTLVCSRFAPSELGRSAAFWAALACGAGGIAIGMLPTQQNASGYMWKWPKAVRTPLLAALFFAFSYVTISAGLFAIFTEMYGVPGTMPAIVAYWSGDKYGRICHHPQLAENYFAGHMCFDYDTDKAFPDGAAILLHGRKSPFGIIMKSISR